MPGVREANARTQRARAPAGGAREFTRLTETEPYSPLNFMGQTSARFLFKNSSSRSLKAFGARFSSGLNHAEDADT
jgi:hypothetical protein